MTAAAHVVFGTGPAGRSVAAALLEEGASVRMINRSGQSVNDSVETVGGDATDPDFARGVTADAATVYFCLNAPNYHRWAEEFPPLQRSVLGAASAVGAKLVVLENLYLYGPSDAPLRETTPVNPTSSKSRTRADMSTEHYQFEAPFIVDDTAFRTAFGGHTTSWEQIVTSTADWYCGHSLEHTNSKGLAEATTQKVAS